jgi:hypothetical protein
MENAAMSHQLLMKIRTTVAVAMVMWIVLVRDQKEETCSEHIHLMHIITITF